MGPYGDVLVDFLCQLNNGDTSVPEDGFDYGHVGSDSPTALSAGIFYVVFCLVAYLVGFAFPLSVVLMVFGIGSPR